MTHITLDLADILQEKLQFGVSVPVAIDVDQLLEYGDDDWDYELDLTGLLAGRRQAAVLVSAEQVKRQYPHLTDEQAWDVAQRLRDDLDMFVEDAIADAVHINYPSARMQLHSRLLNLRYALRAKEDDRSRRLGDEVDGLLRVFHRLPESAEGNPALEGSIAAALDDIEKLTTQEGGAA